MENKITFTIKVLVVIFILGCIPPAILSNIEPRSILAQLLMSGLLPLTAIIFLMVCVFLIVVLSLFKGKIFEGLLVISVAAITFLFFVFFAALGYGEIGIFKQDRIIYTSIKDSKKKLIVQYYEVGVTGNPRWRTIIVHNQRANFRKYEELSLDFHAIAGQEMSVIGDGHINYSLLPKSIGLFKEERFILESVWLFSGEIITKKSEI
ncbi:hypothetical protein Q0590_15875 [Rhodocytophaga aerolata]|uniref:Uncharacterized protein n=1 Tax=Rhodocytophaga aerolata TaxID=455078 RepID=A0ABT8R6M6_9BACT|nr:hypothetical protein [Rhodocytophaga aerolata]MDO1447750.1 hypothetical protein [Rhodocytophaga aerolata]